MMPWLCLERCNFTTPQVQQHINTLLGPDQGCLWSAVSYERFNLGAHSTLVVDSTLTLPSSQLASHGMPALPMISSYPYPPQLLDWMRQVWQEPKPFLSSLRQHAQELGAAGVNFDWEPSASVPAPTSEDAAAYAGFLAQAVTALAPLRVTVDVARWSAVWNYTKLAQVPGLVVTTMSTYVADDKIWQQEFDAAVASFQPDQLVVGLEHSFPNGTAYPQAMVAARLQACWDAGIRAIAVWDVPVPAPFTAALQAFQPASLHAL